MNTSNDNPYPDPSPTPPKKPDGEKGTAVIGFFIGWSLIIGSSLITIFIVSVLINIASATSGGNDVIYQAIALISFLIPIAIIISAMVWFGKKGKSKTVKGIGAAIISLIALAILLVAACFGILAMSGGGSGWH